VITDNIITMTRASIPFYTQVTIKTSKRKMADQQNPRHDDIRNCLAL